MIQSHTLRIALALCSKRNLFIPLYVLYLGKQPLVTMDTHLSSWLMDEKQDYRLIDTKHGPKNSKNVKIGIIPLSMNPANAISALDHPHGNPHITNTIVKCMFWSNMDHQNLQAFPLRQCSHWCFFILWRPGHSKSWFFVLCFYVVYTFTSTPTP